MPIELIVNGECIDGTRYLGFHRKRLRLTLDALRKLGAKRIVELGGHPWVMTSALLDDGHFELAATISAEEVTNWPDDIGATRREYGIRTLGGREMTFPNYSANLERTLFNIQERPDTVIACEIIEHLLRSPHIMLLNINRWLPRGGKLLMSTPNGAQFSNPFRRKSSRPAYRCNVYARHNYLFTLSQLIDIVELCGFKVREAGFWNVYQRTGLSLFYSILGALPIRYFKDKFQRTLFVAAEKETDVAELPRLPRCYAPSANWEFIQATANAAERPVHDEG
jgi:hypothetical protein